MMLTIERRAKDHAVTMMLATPGTTQLVYDDCPMSCNYRGRRWRSESGYHGDSWCALADWIDAVEREKGAPAPASHP